jgi:hypothetical protein
MTRAQFITLLKQRLYNNTDSALDAIIVSEMDLVQSTALEGAEFYPWFLLSEFVTSYTTAGERRMALPSDFLAEWEDGTLWIYDESSSDDKWIELWKDDYDALLARYPGEGKPVAYAQDNGYFYLFPQPDAIHTLKMRYYQKQTLPSDLADGETNLWLTQASDWFLTETGYTISAFHLDLRDLEVKFDKARAESKRRLYVKHVALEEQNIHRTMGD